MGGRLRVVPLTVASAPLNMARDESLLEAVAAGSAPPTLRLYRWRGRWLSLGMAESIADVDRVACAAAGAQLVRRPSGGAAVLHTEQVAWSLALPSSHPLAHPDVVASYRTQAEIALEACRRLGIEARAIEPERARAPLPDDLLALTCFGAFAPYEIVVGEPPRKLIGWGQVRRRGVVLHHAVLSLRFNGCALAGLLRADQQRLTAALALRVTDLWTEAARRVSARELVAALTVAHGGAGFEPCEAPLSAAEERRAKQLVGEKYGDARWTERR